MESMMRLRQRHIAWQSKPEKQRCCTHAANASLEESYEDKAYLAESARHSNRRQYASKS